MGDSTTYVCRTCGTPRKLKSRAGKIDINKNCHSCAGRLLNPARWSTTHGGHKTKLYGMWCGMKGRCNYPSHPAYQWYGAKGIQVCAAWSDDFAVFRAWALASGYAEGLQLDRKDSDKGYYPLNCRWVTPRENSANKKSLRVNLLDVAVIKRLLLDGKRPKDIAKIYRVLPCLISHIKVGRTWGYVQPA